MLSAKALRSASLEVFLGCDETTWGGGGFADPPLAMTGPVDVGCVVKPMGWSLEGVAMRRTEGVGPVSLEIDAAT